MPVKVSTEGAFPWRTWECPPGSAPLASHPPLLTPQTSLNGHSSWIFGGSTTLLSDGSYPLPFLRVYRLSISASCSQFPLYISRVRTFCSSSSSRSCQSQLSPQRPRSRHPRPVLLNWTGPLSLRGGHFLEQPCLILEAHNMRSLV